MLNLRFICSLVVYLETAIVTTVVTGKEKGPRIKETINTKSLFY